MLCVPIQLFLYLYLIRFHIPTRSKMNASHLIAFLSFLFNSNLKTNNNLSLFNGKHGIKKLLEIINLNLIEVFSR